MKTPASVLRLFSLQCAAAAAVLAPAAVASAQSYEVVQAFELPPGRPEGELCVWNGELYGTTPSGGDHDRGTIFKVTTSGQLQVLHSFGDPNAEGAAISPFGGLAFVSDDPGGAAFYGTTLGGGAHGKGTLYRFVPGQPPQVVYSFDETEGWGPRNTLLRASDGFLYGATVGGGANGYGTLFRYQPAGALTSFFSLGSGHYVWRGKLVEGPDAVYAVAYGTGGDTAIVYRVVTGAVPEAALFAAIGASDLDNFYAGYGVGVAATARALYLTTWSGYFGVNGAVVRVDLATRAASLVHAFPGGPGGRNPRTGLVKESEAVLVGGVTETSFLGATGEDGVNEYGTIFRLVVQEGPGPAFSSSVVTLDDFDPWSEGREPLASLVRGPDGFFYGTTWGGVVGDRGGVYRFADGRLEQWVAFGRTGTGQVGWSPAGIAGDPDAGFYGVTWLGGDGGQGTVFAQGTGGPEVLAPFEAATSSLFAQGRNSRPVLARDDRYYLTTELGGAQGKGAILRLAAGGHELETVHSFDGTDGARPQELVACADGRLYGAAYSGGNDPRSGAGTLFAFDVASGELEVLHELDALEQGIHPIGTLACDAERAVYGVTSSGGDSFQGTVFRLSPTETGWAHDILHRFNDVQGSSTPYAGLMLASDGLLYGTTGGRGRPSDGTAFRIARDGSGFEVLHDFQGDLDGCTPAATLAQAPDGWLYGTTRGGYFCQLRSGWWGSIFRVHPVTRAFEVVKTFDSTSGVSPEAGLLFAADGSLYGTTTAGGPRGGGVIFRIALAVADAGGPYRVGEGGTVGLSATCSEAGATFEWDLDDDGSFDATGATATFSAAGLDGEREPVPHVVRVRARYGAGRWTEDTTLVLVLNQAPTVSAGPDVSLIAGEALVRHGSATDPGPDTLTATVDWGDLSPAALSIDGGSFSLNHAYPAEGNFLVMVTVIDDDGGIGHGEFAVSVASVEDALAELIREVEDLVAAGLLNTGQGRSLIAKLEAALKQLANGKPGPAVNQLQAFVNELAALVGSGRLPSETGRPLADTANRVIAVLS